MKLVKTIYGNNKVQNVFESENEKAYVELVNVLMNKIDKRYKINIKKDSVYRTITIDLYFESFGTKYKYHYEFSEIDEWLDLR
jgi:hypothetical protein